MPRRQTARRIPLRRAALAPANGARWQGLLEVLQAFRRWELAYAPATVVEQTFLQAPPEGLCSLERTYPPHRHVLVQQALDACLAGWTRAVAVSFRSEAPGRLPLRHRVVPTGPGTWGPALDTSRLGYVSPTGERLLVRLALEEREAGKPVSACTLVAPARQAAELPELFATLEAWMAAHPHLRGAKLDARGEFLTLDRVYTWDDLIVDAATQAAIETHIVDFLARLPQVQAYGLPAKRGILLAGPPGTGKTLLGKVLCCTQAATFLWVSPGEMHCPRELPKIFALARECAPTILFLEDLDLYASRRGGDKDALLGELLNQLDGFPANTGVLTLATTNDPQAIEPALGERPSRFDATIRFEPPGLPERARLLARCLRGISHPPEAVAETARLTAGCTGAHLQAVVHRAVEAALAGRPATARGPVAITAGQLAAAVQQVTAPQRRPCGFGG